jgi:spore germination cell wall hydrolase CwlJ-like protein
MLDVSKIKLTLLTAIVVFVATLVGEHYYSDYTLRVEREIIMNQQYEIIENKKFAQQPKKINANQEYIRCMATNIYHEAGSEPFMGQVMVARVVVNRMKHGFGKNPCSVIYAQHDVPTKEDATVTRRVCQFSWVCEGKDTPERNAAYRQAEDIAKKVLTENAWHDIVPSNVLFFHNTSVNPRWAYERVATIGNHVFYSKNSDKQ